MGSEMCIRDRDEDCDSYRLAQVGAIEFLSINDARTTKPKINAQWVADDPNVVEARISARPCTTYPATRDLLDSLDLGLVFAAGESHARLREVGEEIRSRFDSIFA